MSFFNLFNLYIYIISNYLILCKVILEKISFSKMPSSPIILQESHFYISAPLFHRKPLLQPFHKHFSTLYRSKPVLSLSCVLFKLFTTLAALVTKAGATASFLAINSMDFLLKMSPQSPCSCFCSKSKGSVNIPIFSLLLSTL